MANCSDSQSEWCSYARMSVRALTLTRDHREWILPEILDEDSMPLFVHQTAARQISAIFQVWCKQFERVWCRWLSGSLLVCGEGHCDNDPSS